MLPRLTASKIVSLLLLTTLFFSGHLQEGLTYMVKAQFNNSYQQQLQNEIHDLLKAEDLPSHKGQYISNLRLNKPSKIPTSNFYLRTLNSFAEEIKPSVYEGMSLVTDYSTQELENIFEYNNLQPFLSSESNFNQVRTLQNDYQDLVNLYNQEKQFFINLAQIKQKTAIYEIFVDNNTQNSSFDLLTDLNQIEQKLFQSSQDQSIQYSNRNNFWNQFNSEPILTTLQPVSSLVFNQFSSSSSSNQQTNDQNSNANNQNSNNSNANNPSTLDPTPEYQFPTIQYGAVCEIDPKLKQELDIFTEEQDSANSSSPNSNSTNPSSNQNSDIDSSDSNSSPANTNSPNSNSETNFNSDFFDQNNSCQPDQLFCFTREVKYNQVDLIYPEGDSDCIACSINRLNKSLQTLLDNGVLPQKITGNFGEPAICKQGAIGKIPLNINLIPKPILPEMPDTSQIQNTNSQTIESNQTQQNSPSKDPNFSISEQTRIDTDSNILGQSSSLQYAQNFDQQLQSDFSQNAKVNRAIQDQQILFDKLSNQINTLNLYFQSFQGSLEDMNANFIELANLPECSTL